MAIPAGGTPSEVQTGDTVHIRGGMDIGYLTGRFVKQVSSTGLVTHQNAMTGADDNVQINGIGGGGGATVIESIADLPSPSMTTIGDVYISKADQLLFVGIGDVHVVANATGTFNTIPQRSDLSATDTLITTPYPPVNSFWYDYYDGHFYQVQTISGQSRYVQVTAADALAASRTANTYDVVFLGSKDSDADALGDIPTIDADTDYFYLQSTGSLLFQRLDLTTYTAATTVTDHYRWLTIGSGAQGGRVGLLTANFDNNLSSADADVQTAFETVDDLVLGDLHLADTYGNLPAPGADREGEVWFIVNTKTLYVCDGYQSFGTLPTGTFNAVTLPSNRIIADRLPDAGSVAAGTWAYEIRSHDFYRRFAGGFQPTWLQGAASIYLTPLLQTSTDTPHFLGDFDSDNDAVATLAARASNTEYFYVRTTDHAMRTLDNYTAGASPMSHYSWVPIVSGDTVFTPEDRALLEEIAANTNIHESLSFVRAGTVESTEYSTAARGYITNLAEWNDELWVIFDDGTASVRNGTDVNIWSTSHLYHGVARNGDFWFIVDDDMIHSINATTLADDQQHQWRTNPRSGWEAQDLYIEQSEPTILWQMVFTSRSDPNGTADMHFFAYDVATDGSLTERDDITVTRANLNAAIGVNYRDLTSIADAVDGTRHRPGEGVISFAVEGDRVVLFISAQANVNSQSNEVLLAAFTLAGIPGARTLTPTPTELGVLPTSAQSWSMLFRDDNDDIYLGEPLRVYHYIPKVNAFNAPGLTHTYRATPVITNVGNLDINDTVEPDLPGIQRTQLFTDSMLILETPSDISGLPASGTLRIQMYGGGSYEWLDFDGEGVQRHQIIPSASYLLQWDGTNWLSTSPIDYVGNAISLRDKLDIGFVQEGEHNDAFATMGQIYEAGHNGAEIVETQMRVTSHTGRTFRAVIQRGTYSGGTFTTGDVVYATPTNQQHDPGPQTLSVADAPLSPVTFARGEFFAVYLVRTSSLATDTCNHRRGNTDQTSNFQSLSTFNLDLTDVGWFQVAANTPQASGQAITVNTASYRFHQNITYNIPLVGGDVQAVHGTPVAANLEFRGNQPSLDTLRIGTTTYQTPARRSDAGIQNTFNAQREVVTPTASGVLYTTIDAEGSGYTAAPTVTVTGGGGTNAAFTAAIDSGAVETVLPTNRGTGYTSAPTLTFSGGNGTGAMATAHVGTYSTITQDFTDELQTSRIATAHFDLARSLTQSDEDKLCYVSFNAQRTNESTFDFVRVYCAPFPVEDFLTLPAIAPADVPVNTVFDETNVPSLFLNTTRADDPGNPPNVGVNGLWLIKLSGGDADRRIIFARGQVIRSAGNIRFELR